MKTVKEKEVGLVVKMAPALHERFKAASAEQKRSMQKVVTALIEGWLQNGAPDPLVYGNSETGGGGTIDDKARAGIMALANEMKAVKDRLDLLEGATNKGPSRKQFDAFYEALLAASGSPSA